MLQLKTVAVGQDYSDSYNSGSLLKHDRSAPDRFFNDMGSPQKTRKVISKKMARINTTSSEYLIISKARKG